MRTKVWENLDPPLIWSYLTCSANPTKRQLQVAGDKIRPEKEYLYKPVSGHISNVIDIQKSEYNLAFLQYLRVRLLLYWHQVEYFERTFLLGYCINELKCDSNLHRNTTYILKIKTFSCKKSQKFLRASRGSQNYLNSGRGIFFKKLGFMLMKDKNMNR